MASSNANNGVSVLFLFAVLLIAAPQLAAGINSFLYGACKTIAGGSELLSVTFCIDALSSDNRSSNISSYKEFAVIAVDLLTANATSTKSEIDVKLRNGGGGGGDAATTRCLQSCQAVYGDILQAQAAVGAAVKAGRFQEAISSLEKSASEVKECQDGFGKSNVTSPLSVENDDAFQLAELIVLLIRDEQINNVFCLNCLFLIHVFPGFSII
uniref:Pectinesterase inhibitor domain-containing protein n=2 Tax=Oryza TaxID=4527 RepID=A0A0D3HHS8_9ORYZ